MTCRGAAHARPMPGHTRRFKIHVTSQNFILFYFTLGAVARGRCAGDVPGLGGARPGRMEPGGVGLDGDRWGRVTRGPPPPGPT